MFIMSGISTLRRDSYILSDDGAFLPYRLMAIGRSLCCLAKTCITDNTIAQTVASFSLWQPRIVPRSVQWHMWWTRLHWDRFFSELFDFPLPQLSATTAPHIYLCIFGGCTVDLLVAAVPMRCSLHQNNNNNIYTF
jgi:hypothetical protein